MIAFSAQLRVAGAPVEEFKKQTSLGVKAAESLTQVTGVAISPLLGMGALGAYKYYRATPSERESLPWFAQPWFFGAALLLVAVCMAKDAAGPVVPTSLKKPLDLVELFENKASALLATGVVIPIALEIFEQTKPHLSGALDLAGLHFAAVGLAWMGDLIAVPVALVAFAVVWLVSHTIHVLILISPFTTVDAALKSFRAAILGTVAGGGVLDTRLGAAWSLILVLICVLLAPWAFRTVTFGTLFAWDLVTFRRKRFVPDEGGIWMFSARPVGSAPTRAYGRLIRDDEGRLTFVWRPWLVFPARTEVVPPGRYVVGKGIVHSEILRVEEGRAPDVFNLPPRCNSHEEAIARIYGFSEVRPVGLRAAWTWIKGLFSPGTAGTAARA
ncbi:MAG: hypothetical protein U1G08_01570 [Verrucomicrobiota bacterium]